MTDRELLELAAKAAGLKIIKWGESDYYSHRYGEVAYVCATEKNDPWGDEWDPLKDDGDALALAVRVFLTVEVEDGFTEVLTGIGMAITESHNGDALSATRRAIVRAAAEIGRRR
jgi:hypothetical protein